MDLAKQVLAMGFKEGKAARSQGQRAALPAIRTPIKPPHERLFRPTSFAESPAIGRRAVDFDRVRQLAIQEKGAKVRINVEDLASTTFMVGEYDKLSILANIMT